MCIAMHGVHVASHRLFYDLEISLLLDLERTRRGCVNVSLDGVMQHRSADVPVYIPVATVAAFTVLQYRGIISRVCYKWILVHEDFQ